MPAPTSGGVVGTRAFLSVVFSWHWPEKYDGIYMLVRGM